MTEHRLTVIEGDQYRGVSSWIAACDCGWFDISMTQGPLGVLGDYRMHIERNAVDEIKTMPLEFALCHPPFRGAPLRVERVPEGAEEDPVSPPSPVAGQSERCPGGAGLTVTHSSEIVICAHCGAGVPGFCGIAADHDLLSFPAEPVDHCKRQSPDGWICTEPVGHDGDHVAHGCDGMPHEGTCNGGTLPVRWPNEKDAEPEGYVVIEAEVLSQYRLLTKDEVPGIVAKCDATAPYSAPHRVLALLPPSQEEADNEPRCGVNGCHSVATSSMQRLPSRGSLHQWPKSWYCDEHSPVEQP